MMFHLKETISIHLIISQSNIKVEDELCFGFAQYELLSFLQEHFLSVVLLYFRRLNGVMLAFKLLRCFLHGSLGDIIIDRNASLVKVEL